MPLAAANLFGAPLLPGFAYAEDLVTPDEEALLIAAVDAAGLSPFRFQGWLGKRLTTSFGWRYDFDDGAFSMGTPLPEWLLPLREKAADFAGLPAGDFAHALLIRYDPGAGIGWHRDRPVFEHVVGVSLGNPAVMRFRRRRPGGFDRFAVPISPALGLSSLGRGTARLGAQPGPDGRAALVDHLPELVRKGPRAQFCVLIVIAAAPPASTPAARTSSHGPYPARSGLSASASKGATIAGSVLVRLRMPRSRPRCAGEGSNCIASADCIARNTDMPAIAAPKPSVATGQVDAAAMIASPVAIVIDEAARNGFRRIIRSERRPAAIVSTRATMVTPAKIAATPSLAASALLLSGIFSPSTARK